LLIFVCLATIGLAQGGNSYIFPGLTTNNDITIGNLNPQPTTATIAFYDSTGKLNSLTAELEPGTQTRVNPTSVALTSFNGSVVLRKFVPGVAGAVTRSDFAIVPAIPQNEFGTASVIPFFVQGPDYFSMVQVDNLASSEQTVSITATRADGTPLPGTNNPASVILPPYGSTRQEMATLFGNSATGFSTGTITVTSQGTKTTAGATSGPRAPLAASVAIRNISEASLAIMFP